VSIHVKEWIAMQNQVFLQVVTTFWTKISRGAPNAGARNVSPDAFALSDDEVEQLLTGECFSHVVFHEREGFRARRSVATFPPLNGWRWGPVSVNFLNNGVAVVNYKHRPWSGAPDRSSRAALRYELSADTMLRIKNNCRESWPAGEWSYRLEVFNIVRTENPSTEMFLVEPAKYVSDMAELW
jgi:hypothetical protein